MVTSQGADGSFLLNSTQFPGNVSEKSSTAQVGMRNSKYINDIKIAVDYACPKRVVSCADVLAVAGAAAVNVVSEPFIVFHYFFHNTVSDFEVKLLSRKWMIIVDGRTLHQGQDWSERQPLQLESFSR